METNDAVAVYEINIPDSDSEKTTTTTTVAVVQKKERKPKKEKEVKPEKEQTRKNVEFNFTELLFPMLLMYSEINNFEEFLEKIELFEKDPTCNSKIKFNSSEDISKYKLDVLDDKKKNINKMIKKKKNINEMIKKFKTIEIEKQFQPDNIVCIYISGKKNTHIEIEELNKGLDIKEKKSDVYIKLLSGEFVGVSIKQDNKAPKTNFSVEKLLPKEESIKRTKIKKVYLTEKGFELFDKNQRDPVNQLFYPQNKDNPYMRELKDAINIHKNELGEKLVYYLYCLNVNYPIYEYDGTSFTKLHDNKLHDNFHNPIISFEEHIPYYLNENGEEREAAKLYYRLCVDEKIFRVEVRWKGNIHNASPQFQTFNDFSN
jgi:hypothetical protein